jgi:hypothetical protein
MQHWRSSNTLLLTSSTMQASYWHMQHGINRGLCSSSSSGDLH